jgi:monoamine oxidase
LVSCLGKGLDIRLSHVVEKISYTNPKNVVITTTTKQIRADAVLITVPLGVLKKG